MTRIGRRLAWTITAAAIVLAAGIAAVVPWWPRAPPGVIPSMVPAAWAEFRTSPGHQLHVGRLKLDCGACHDFERDGFKNPGTSVCKNCHAKETALAHRGGSGNDATGCLTCHAFAPGRPAPTCIGCHAQRHGEAAAITQHATIDCATCHRVHASPSIVAADCTGCHVERAIQHADHQGSKGCLDCHRAHVRPAAAVSACSSCHALPAGPRPASHESCIGCHQPHDFVAGGERACIRCHGQKRTLAADAAPAHGICTSCHTPHAPTEAAASCAGCHATVHVSHGTRGSCVVCHAPHGDDPRLVAASCTSCHANVAASDAGAHAGGVACKGCHKPHAFTIADPMSICATCHARETSLVATHAGHQNCTSCHGSALAHAPAKAPSCGTCHAAEQASAPSGHQKCEGCHDPHASQPTPVCATCHKSEATGPHQSVQGGCATCHRPHGPGGVASPPSCTTCHARSSLPALHAVPGHVDCANCHVAPHEPPRADRVTCTSSCHSDKRNHQPLATACDGCHVFRR
ncbi:MAG: hypothetical protein ABSC94_33895 [Polyangiaceae bacterium]